MNPVMRSETTANHLPPLAPLLMLCLTIVGVGHTATSAGAAEPTSAGTGDWVNICEKLLPDFRAADMIAVDPTTGDLYMYAGYTNWKNNLQISKDQGAIWTNKAPNLDKRNFLYADGLIWSMDGANGDLRIIKPEPAAYKELARDKLLAGHGIWGMMALSNGRLLARDDKQLKCIDLRADK